MELADIVLCVCTLLSGVFTFLGVWLTLRRDRKKEEKAEKEKILKRRPNFEILYVDKIEKYNKNVNSDLTVFYSKPINHKDYKKYLIEDNWKSVIYTLKNIGLEQIETISISADNDNSIYSLDNLENYLKEGCSISCVPFGKTVNPKGEVSIKIVFPEELANSKMTYPVWFWFRDYNCNLWKQRLDAPIDDLKYSEPTTEEEVFKKRIIL